MNSVPGAAKVIELIERLRETVREFAVREVKLRAELHSKLAVERRSCSTAMEEVAREFEAGLADANAALQAARERAEARHQERAARIRVAARTSTERALRVVEENTGRRRYEIQKQVMQAEHRRDAGLAMNDQSIAELRATEEELRKLEGSAGEIFKLRQPLPPSPEDDPPAESIDTSAAVLEAIAEIRRQIEFAQTELGHFTGRPLPRRFRHPALWCVAMIAAAPLAWILPELGVAADASRLAAGVAGGLAFVGFVLCLIARAQARPVARRVAAALGAARRLHDLCAVDVGGRHQRERQRIEREAGRVTQDLNQEWHLVSETAEVMADSARRKIEDKARRAQATNDRLRRQKLETLERAHAGEIQRLEKEAASRRRQLEEARDQTVAKLAAGNAARLQALTIEWQTRIQPVCEVLDRLRAADAALFPPWNADSWAQWSPPQRFGQAARFGRLELDLEKLCESLPKDDRLAFPGAPRLALPMLLTFPFEGSILFETAHSGRAEAVGALNQLVARLLSTAPPGRVNFTVIDPVGLGQSFSALMHLADYEERLIHGRIWTQPAQIDQRLAELNEHMEKVIQMYLRNDYPTIAEYNEQAGNIAEPYHFLVVADFPVNFSATAARRLLSVATSGARCGVHTLIHWDRRHPLPQDFTPDDLRKSSVGVTAGKDAQFTLGGKALPGVELVLDPPPPADFLAGFIHKVGACSRDSNRVEVPFAHVAPEEGEWWTGDTTDELRVPIGRTAATKLQHLALGRDTRQHALIAGKTGSGKSTLFHVIITNLALWCGPDQVEFYLIDFKKGVEFKCYAAHRLPHARVVAIESDREFGLSVLQRVDEELRRRGDLFRKLGVQNIAAWRKASREPMPRCLLIIDEFQEFFVEDDKISQTASMLLDRIVRQGRAFGIHVILGSQTLGGAYSVARTTLGQMVVRIALQCNEADAYLIMDDTNAAPRLLSRPGEAIYNDAAGALAGNSPFQAVWLPDDVRDRWLAKAHELAKRAAEQAAAPLREPIVFEGNAPADARENRSLHDLLHAESIQPVSAPRVWLGAPNSIKGPTEAVFQRQGGNHLLIVGQRDEALLAMFGVGLVSLAAQLPRGGARFLLLDASPPGSPEREFLERAAHAVPHGVAWVKNNELAETLAALVAELERRAEDTRAGDRPATFLLIHGLQKFGKLRHEDDYGLSGADEGDRPGALLNRLICEGAGAGIHLIAAVDTCNNVNRFLSRRSLGEFGMRVLFQMSVNDSAVLIDSARASTLGLHRALFYNEQEGYLEVFRPYALPSADWLEQAAVRLRRLHG